jgi:UDP-N-acetyl-D-mannosaminuronic acid transferase (WecB/TagA/CpsF family)
MPVFERINQHHAAIFVVGRTPDTSEAVHNVLTQEYLHLVNSITA